MGYDLYQGCGATIYAAGAGVVMTAGEAGWDSPCGSTMGRE